MRLLSSVFALLFALSLTTAHATPTYFSLQWNMRAIRAGQAYRYAKTQGRGVTICSIDTGAPLDNPDITPALIGGTNTVTPGSTSYVDDQGHGTHTAGIEVGRGVNIRGVAPQASLLAVKVLAADGSGSDESVTAGVLWCAGHHANVINMSMGGGAAAYDGFQAAVDYACSQGITIAVASGNDTTNTATDPAAIESPCLVAVNATDEHGRFASFSNFQENIRSVSAPGQNILSDFLNGSVAYASGTSMSAPHVSGTLALLMGMGVPAKSAIAIVLITARKPPKGEDVTMFGFGSLDAGAACKLAYQEGYGR